MRIEILTLSCLMLGCGVAPLTTVSRSESYTKPAVVVVLPFDGQYSLGLQSDGPGGAMAATGCLRALTSAGISLVSRAALEEELKQGGALLLDDAKASALAKRLGADLVIVGSTVSGKFQLVANVRALDSNGAVIARVQTNEMDKFDDGMFALGHHACAVLFSDPILNTRP